MRKTIREQSNSVSRGSPCLYGEAKAGHYVEKQKNTVGFCLFMVSAKMKIYFLLLVSCPYRNKPQDSRRDILDMPFPDIKKHLLLKSLKSVSYPCASDVSWVSSAKLCVMTDADRQLQT